LSLAASRCSERVGFSLGVIFVLCYQLFCNAGQV
jgi:hypothetical protein